MVPVPSLGSGGGAGLDWAAERTAAKAGRGDGARETTGTVGGCAGWARTGRCGFCAWSRW